MKENISFFTATVKRNGGNINETKKGLSFKNSPFDRI